MEFIIDFDELCANNAAGQQAHQFYRRRHEKKIYVQLKKNTNTRTHTRKLFDAYLFSSQQKYAMRACVYILCVYMELYSTIQNGFSFVLHSIESVCVLTYEMSYKIWMRYFRFYFVIVVVVPLFTNMVSNSEFFLFTHMGQNFTNNGNNGNNKMCSRFRSACS